MHFVGADWMVFNLNNLVFKNNKLLWATESIHVSFLCPIQYSIIKVRVSLDWKLAQVLCDLNEKSLDVSERAGQWFFFFL